jgi:hypothetical protein
MLRARRPSLPPRWPDGTACLPPGGSHWAHARRSCACGRPASGLGPTRCAGSRNQVTIKAPDTRCGAQPSGPRHPCPPRNGQSSRPIRKAPCSPRVCSPPPSAPGRRARVRCAHCSGLLPIPRIPRAAAATTAARVLAIGSRARQPDAWDGVQSSGLLPSHTLPISQPLRPARTSAHTVLGSAPIHISSRSGPRSLPCVPSQPQPVQAARRAA